VIELENNLIINTCYEEDKRFRNIEDRKDSIPFRRTKDIERRCIRHQIRNNVVIINFGEINNRYD
jgi:hypothetical protein